MSLPWFPRRSPPVNPSSVTGRFMKVHCLKGPGKLDMSPVVSKFFAIDLIMPAQSPPIAGSCMKLSIGVVELLTAFKFRSTASILCLGSSIPTGNLMKANELESKVLGMRKFQKKSKSYNKSYNLKFSKKFILWGRTRSCVIWWYAQELGTGPRSASFLVLVFLFWENTVESHH